MKHKVCTNTVMLDSVARKLMHDPDKLFMDHCKPGMKVLDFGCGTGFLSIPLAELGANVIAVDIQQKMLDLVKARVKGKRLKGKLRLVHSNGDLPVKEKVGLVLLAFVLHEVKNRKKVILQIKRILHKDGKVIFIEPKIEVSKQEFYSELKMFRDAGFQVEKEQRKLFSRDAVFRKR
jgi:ubiquinone/menaquinone biosynthesis C-methylase UbiE